MSAPEKPSRAEELRRIEDALVESTSNASEEELREEYAEAGEDVTEALARIDAVIARARADVGRDRLQVAKVESERWQRARAQRNQSGQTSPPTVRIEAFLRSHAANDQERMMAARKATKQSDKDIEGLAEDIDDLEGLEREDPESR